MFRALSKSFAVAMSVVSAASVFVPTQALGDATAVIELYDRQGFKGRQVVARGPVADLDAVNFDNRAASVRVVSGTWTLYRNDGFGVTASRPSVSLGPGDYPNLAAVGFPRDRLSSLKPTSFDDDLNVTIGGEPGPDGSLSISIFDGRNFTGREVRLTASERDLDHIRFDNRAESVIVHGGRWVLYRNDNFGVTDSRPLLALSPGAYPDLRDVGFPRNRLSSVQHDQM